MQSFKDLANYILTHSKHNTVKSDKVHIILDWDKIKWSDYKQYLMTLTWFTSIPWNSGGSKSMNLIFASNLDEAVKQADEYDYAMISSVGTFYNSYQFDKPDTIHTYFEDFCKSNLPCRGHILWHPNKQYGTLHLQSMFLNLKHWRKIGRPSFGHYTGEAMLPQLSKTHVHDNYTPHWLTPSNNYTQLKNAPMGEYITRVLEDGRTIYNYDRERSTKFFDYPHRGYMSDGLIFERNRNQNIIYTKNNEKFLKCPDIKYDFIFAPASGYTAEYLYKHCSHENTKLIIFDNNEHMLNWKKKVYELAYSESDVNRITNYFKQEHDCIIDNISYKPELLKENENTYSTQEWLNDTKQITNVEFLHFDVVNKFLNIDMNYKNLLYFSNIFSYQFLLHQNKIEDIHNQFMNYCNLKNTTVIGKNVFKDGVINEA